MRNREKSLLALTLAATRDAYTCTILVCVCTSDPSITYNVGIPSIMHCTRESRCICNGLGAQSAREPPLYMYVCVSMRVCVCACRLRLRRHSTFDALPTTSRQLAMILDQHCGK